MQSEHRHLGIQPGGSHREPDARGTQGARDFGGDLAAAAQVRELRHPDGQRRQVAQLERGASAQRRVAFGHGQGQHALELTLSRQDAAQLGARGVAREVDVDAEVAVLEHQRLVVATLRERTGGRIQRGPSGQAAVAGALQVSIAFECALDADGGVWSRQRHQHVQRQRAHRVVGREAARIAPHGGAHRDLIALEAGIRQLERIARDRQLRGLGQLQRRNVRHVEPELADGAGPAALGRARRTMNHARAVPATRARHAHPVRRRAHAYRRSILPTLRRI